MEKKVILKSLEKTLYHDNMFLFLIKLKRIILFNF